MSLNVNVSLETSDEFKVQEISYDGTEKFQPPLSMSENFMRLVHRIDFPKYPEDEETEITESTSKDSSGSDSKKQVAPFQASLWPWDSVRNKLRNALTEVSVLLDVLNVAKTKKHMVLDPVSHENVDVRPIVNMIAKKKAFVEAARIINTGVEKIRMSKNDAARNMTSDFHSELMTMRQNWRLRRAGNLIVGDLSYRSAGSWYPHPGTFEVTKTEPSTSLAPQLPHLSGTMPAAGRPSVLKVKIPGDLEGISYIHVSIQENRNTLASGNLSFPMNQPNVTSVELNWQQKLENAQNVLFCKELFSKLAREAVEIQTPIPSLVVGNQIIATLFPGIQLCITLCHRTLQSKRRKLERQEHANESVLDSEKHYPVLEHSLHQLLRRVHYKALHHPMPHPATATLGISRKRYFAGPEGYDKHTLLETLKSETMLEKIIEQGQHVVLRAQTIRIIDNLAREIQDPLIISHWTCLNSATKSSVKINIISKGYETIHRTPLVVHVETKGIRVIRRDGCTSNLSEVSQLRYLILVQISQHMVNTVHQLCKMMGWKVLSSTVNSGASQSDLSGNTSALLAASSHDERLIYVRHSPSMGAEVSISASPREIDFYPNSLVRDQKWQNLDTGFKKVDLDKMNRKSLLNKIEFLMASATI